jgi:hypothetical protein
MKKDYLRPEVQKVDLCTVNMLAASTVAEMSAGPQEEAPAAGEKRGGWGNLWK